MITTLLGLAAPICMQYDTKSIQESVVREYTVDRIDNQEGLIYSLGSDLWVHWKNKKRTDCSWIYAWLWMHLWLRDDQMWKHLNSYKFFQLWEEYRDINLMQKWDVVFFESSNWYHIAMVTKPYKEWTIEIMDRIYSINKSRSPESRSIKIVYYWWSWHYNINKNKRFKLRFATNIFVEELLKQNKTFSWTTAMLHENKKLYSDYTSEYNVYMDYHSILNPLSEYMKGSELRWLSGIGLQPRELTGMSFTFMK